MIKNAPPFKVFFYRTNGGAEPVREWLKSLHDADKKIIGADVKTLQYGWPIGMPLVRKLGSGLWEIRSKLDNRIARVLLTAHDDKLVLLHGFIKKTQKTPPQDLKLAKDRLSTLEKKR